jgi:hypothetical protein
VGRHARAFETRQHERASPSRRPSTRVLFAFDPRRTAILLVGGDKTNEWSAWYERAIPEADRLYDEHLAELREEGTDP